jgi:hypothetical protein
MKKKRLYYLYIILFPTKKLTKKVINLLTHTKQVAFHGPDATEVYAVAFDVFAYSPRPRRVF